MLDDIAIWDRALSASEVSALTSGGIPRRVTELSEGLIGYWPFDDQSETTQDLSDYLNAGTVNGEPEWVAGHSGFAGDSAIQFDGQDDSVTTEVSLLNDLAELTLSFWILMPEQQPGNRVGLIGQNDAVEYGMINPTTMQYWTPAGAINVDYGPTVDEWTHVAVVVNSDGFVVYSNGEVVGETGGGGPVSSGDTFNMGGDGIYDATGNFFLGSMDDVAVYNIALSPDDIAALASGDAVPIARGAAGAGGPPPPDNGWVFSDQNGETAAPTFGNAAGTLSGGVEWSTEDPFGSGGSVSFNGTDGTVVMEDLATAFNDLPNFSLSMWIKANSTGIDKGFWEAVDSGGGDLWGLRYDSTGATAGGSDVIKLGITTSESGGNTNRGADQQESHEGTQTTEWQNIVMTWEDGVGFNLYIDGELDEPTLAMQNTAGTTALMDRFVLGDGAKAYWDGIIDEVAVWSLTLSADDAAWLAQNSIASLEGDAPAAKPTIGVVRNADGTVTVTYTGKLQVAPTVNGPWEDVEGATSPLTLQPDQPATFGRTVSE